MQQFEPEFAIAVLEVSEIVVLFLAQRPDGFVYSVAEYCRTIRLVTDRESLEGCL